MSKDVYVFCEQRDGVIQNVSYELIGKAKELAADLGQQVVGIVAGSGIGDLPQKLIARGADKVVIADKPILKEYSTKPYTDVVVKVVKDLQPEVVIFGATSIGRDLAPSVSTMAAAASSALRSVSLVPWPLASFVVLVTT